MCVELWQNVDLVKVSMCVCVYQLSYWVVLLSCIGNCYAYGLKGCNIVCVCVCGLLGGASFSLSRLLFNS